MAALIAPVDPSPSLATSAVLACKGLSKTYHMGEVEVRALDNVDFELRRGELLVLLGASGSGKSTLLELDRSRERGPRHRHLRCSIGTRGRAGAGRPRGSARSLSGSTLGR